MAPFAACSETIAYDPDKDICFLEADDEKMAEAKPDRYFIFFPTDAHRPCVKDGENKMVRKVVIKVRLE
jgi:YhcH/YjgK/YiaL family protein